MGRISHVTFKSPIIPSFVDGVATRLLQDGVLLRDSHSREIPFFSDGYESGAAPWDFIGDNSGFNTAVAFAGTKSLRTPKQAGDVAGTGGSGSFSLTSFPEKEELYVRCRAYFDPAWSTPNVEGIHLFRISRINAGLHREIDFVIPTEGTQVQFNHYALGGFEGGTFNELIGWDPANFTGAWLCMELYSKLNTPGQSNGVFRFWQNGTLRYEKTNLDYRGSSTEGWNQYNAQSNPGTSVGQWPTAEWWAVDSVELYGFLPSFAGNGCA